MTGVVPLCLIGKGLLSDECKDGSLYKTKRRTVSPTGVGVGIN